MDVYGRTPGGRAPDLLIGRPGFRGPGPRRRAGGLAAALALVCLGSCTQNNPLALVGAPYAVFEAPEAYRDWWSEMEACSRRAGDFARVEWQRVENEADGTFPCGSSRCAGAWQPPHRIYVARSYLLSEPIVKHEMVHDLIQSGNHFDGAFYACGVQDIAHP